MTQVLVNTENTITILISDDQGDGVTGLTDADATAHYRKAGGIVETKTLDGTNFVEVDATEMPGFYEVTFTPSELDTEGEFVAIIKTAGVAIFENATIRLDVSSATLDTLGEDTNQIKMDTDLLKKYVSEDPDPSFVYVADNNDDIRKIDLDTDTVLWTVEFTSTIDKFWDLQVDPDGFVYGVGMGGALKADPDGNVIWRWEDQLDIVECLTIDLDGDVYVGSRGDRVVKLDGVTGDEIWVFTDSSDTIRDLAIDVDNNLFAGTSSGTIYKIDPETGTSITSEGLWPLSWSGSVGNIEIGPDGEVVVSSVQTATTEVVKYDSDGNLVWTFDEGNRHWCLTIDQYGDVYTGDSGSFVKKISGLDGSKIWEYNGPGVDALAVAVDPTGLVYATYDGSLIVLDQGGDELRTFSISTSPTAVDVDPGRYQPYVEAWDSWVKTSAFLISSAIDLIEGIRGTTFDTEEDALDAVSELIQGIGPELSGLLEAINFSDDKTTSHFVSGQDYVLPVKVLSSDGEGTPITGVPSGPSLVVKVLNAEDVGITQYNPSSNQWQEADTSLFPGVYLLTVPGSLLQQEGEVLISVEGGLNWSNVFEFTGSPSFGGVESNSFVDLPENVWIAKADAILTSSDGGQTFETFADEPVFSQQAFYTDITGATPDALFLVGMGANLVFSKYTEAGGWADINEVAAVDQDDAFVSVASNNNNAEAFMVGALSSEGVVYRWSGLHGFSEIDIYDDQTQSTLATSMPVLNTIRRFSNSFIVVGNTGTILIEDGNLASSTPDGFYLASTVPTSANLYGVGGTEGDWYVGGENVLLQNSVASGDEWENVGGNWNDHIETIYDIEVTTDFIWLFGQSQAGNSTIVYSADDGQTWELFREYGEADTHLSSASFGDLADVVIQTPDEGNSQTMGGYALLEDFEMTPREFQSQVVDEGKSPVLERLTRLESKFKSQVLVEQDHVYPVRIVKNNVEVSGLDPNLVSTKVVQSNGNTLTVDLDNTTWEPVSGEDGLYLLTIEGTPYTQEVGELLVILQDVDPFIEGDDLTTALDASSNSDFDSTLDDLIDTAILRDGSQDIYALVVKDVGGQDQIRVLLSSDGGATFTDLEAPTTEVVFNGTDLAQYDVPKIAANDSTVYVAVVKPNDEIDLYVRSSGGSTWDTYTENAVGTNPKITGLEATEAGEALITVISDGGASYFLVFDGQAINNLDLQGGPGFDAISTGFPNYLVLIPGSVIGVENVSGVLTLGNTVQITDSPPPDAHQINVNSEGLKVASFGPNNTGNDLWYATASGESSGDWTQIPMPPDEPTLAFSDIHVGSDQFIFGFDRGGAALYWTSDFGQTWNSFDLSPDTGSFYTDLVDNALLTAAGLPQDGSLTSFEFSTEGSDFDTKELQVQVVSANSETTETALGVTETNLDNAIQGQDSDFQDILTSLSEIKGSGFDENLDSLETIRQALATTDSEADPSHAYVADGGEVKKYDPDTQSQEWFFDTGGTEILGMSTDPDNFVYAMDDNAILYKIDASDGSEVWNFDLSVSSLDIRGDGAVTVGPNGNVFVGIDQSLRKFDSDGNEITSGSWPVTLNTKAYVVRASDTHVYAGGFPVSLDKIDIDTGSIEWTFSPTEDDIRAITIDSQDNVYTGQFGGKFRKVLPSGSEDTSGSWPITLDSRVLSLSCADNDDIIVGLVSGSVDNFLRFDTDGSNQFSIQKSSGPIVSANPDGTIYTSSQNGLELNDSDGNLIWQETIGSSPGFLATEPGDVATFPSSWNDFITGQPFIDVTIKDLIELIQGTSFDEGTDALDSLRDAVDGVGSSIDFSTIENALDEIKGTGFVVDEDDLASIKAAVEAVSGDIDFTTIEQALDDIKGVSFDSSTDALKALRDELDLKATAAELADVKDKVSRILGLSHENFQIVDQEYNDDNKLIGATINLYEEAWASASPGSGDDILASYELSATYDSNGLLTNYLVKKES